MKKSLASIVAVLAVIGFMGCQHQGAYLPKDANKYAYENAENVVLLGSRVQRSVTSPGIQETRLPDGRLQVAAQLRNREERRLEVQANCEFKDAQGFTIDSSPWQTVILTELEQQTVPFTSMNDKAVRYTVRVREAH